MKKYNYDLEGLRGIAALCVVLFHAMLGNLLDPNFNVTSIVTYQFPGHLAVLVFFTLSGYVIGYTSPRKFTHDTLNDYFKKRFVRLYPIYFIVLLITILIRTDNIYTIIASFFFGQVLVAPVISANSSTWSLNFEVIYYILFIVFSFFIARLQLLIIIIIVLSLLIFLSPDFILFSSYAVGLVLWLGGLYIACNIPDRDTEETENKSNKYLSFLFLFLASQQLNPFYTLFHFKSKLIPENIYWAYKAITIADLTFIHYAFL